jgi:hypothetical protein
LTGGGSVKPTDSSFFSMLAIITSQHKVAIEDIKLASFRKQYRHSILDGNGFERGKQRRHNQASPFRVLVFLVLPANAASISRAFRSCRSSVASSFPVGR